MRNKKIYILVFSAICIALNIVLGTITHAMGIPLYLDTLGTILVAALVGPWPGAIVGSLTNIITGLMTNVSDIPFFIVNLVVGLVVGYAVRKFGLKLSTAIILGLVLSIVCPLIGTPIGILVYGGLNGSVSDVLVIALKKSGESIFAASFIRNIASNLIDKIGTMVIAWLIVKYLPRQFRLNLKG